MKKVVKIGVYALPIMGSLVGLASQTKAYAPGKVLGTKRMCDPLGAHSRIAAVHADFDDTLKAGGLNFLNTGKRIGGIDKDYSHVKGVVVYPGIAQMVVELLRNDQGAETGQPIFEESASLQGPLKVWTARLGGVLEPVLRPGRRFEQHLTRVGEKNGIRDLGFDVCYGKPGGWVRSSLKMVNKAKALDETRSELKRDEKMVIFGDNGETDIKAVLRYVEQAKGDCAVAAFFVHIVDEANIEELSDIGGIPVFYYQTIIGAAVDAYQEGLIDKDAVMRIVSSTLDEHEATHPIPDSKINTLIEKDFLRAAVLFPDIADQIKRDNLFSNRA